MTRDPRIRLTLLLALTACSSERFDRDAELARTEAEISARVASLNLSSERVLALTDCERIALSNNLSYRVSLLRTQLQDEAVRSSFAEMLPHADAKFTHTERSNDPAIKTQSPSGGGTAGAAGGGAGAAAAASPSSVSFEDRIIDTFRVGVVLPVIDYGATRYAYEIAQDRRMQDRLMLVRARQTLLRDVRIAYARLASILRDVTLLESEVASNREALKVARSLEREGITSASDTAFVDASVARAELDLTLAQRDALLAHAQLARTMSVPNGVDFRIDPNPPEMPPLPESVAVVRELEDRALRFRPETWSQDLERNVAAASVRKEFAQFFPRLDANLDFNWSSNSRLVNPSYFTFGYTIADSLLNGTEQLWTYRAAEKSVDVEKEHALLVAIGVMFEVDFRILELAKAHDGFEARTKLVAAQQRLFEEVKSRAREGLENGANVARALWDLQSAELGANQTKTDYLVAWYELQAATAADALESPTLEAEKLEPPKSTEPSKTPESAGG